MPSAISVAHVSAGQCVAVCSSVLQCVAVCYSVLQCVAVCCRGSLLYVSACQCVAVGLSNFFPAIRKQLGPLRTSLQSKDICPVVYVSAWQCVEVRCSVLKCVAVYRSVFQILFVDLCRAELCVSCVFLCWAVCCSVLQCAAVCRSVLQCVAVCCSVLQCVAMCVIFYHPSPQGSQASVGLSHKLSEHDSTSLFLCFSGMLWVSVFCRFPPLSLRLYMCA